MKTISTLRRVGALFLVMTVGAGMCAGAAQSQLVGWNNLGMHCMDSDYSVFSILPPYNTIECQLIVNGRLITNGTGYSVTYEAVADPSGSFNSTAMGKGNYYQYEKALYGATLAPEAGLAGWSMPGLSNVPQSMLFENTNHPAPGVATQVNWYRAEGIPIAPYDDAFAKNPYPLMLLAARDGNGSLLATNQVVLPVSDEMDCRNCHASGAGPAAMPAAGWVWSGLPERDYRLNILRLHDEHQFAGHGDLYSAALSARGFNSQGLYRGVLVDGKPVLCAVCHASEALGTSSFETIPPLTASVHAFHAHVSDPFLNTTLDSAANRSACYRCHPGSTTRCLRGAMGSAVASDGSMEMQCQSCHGNMSAVGSANRVGWFMEPGCGSCHTGVATSNNGQIRYNSVFTDAGGTVRIPVDQTFSTMPNTPAPGLSLFRFSAGHGGLQCEACHGSTHAEFPSTHANDNLRNIQLQGHAGMMVECTACHPSMPNTPNRGPHGMHALGQGWITGTGGVTKHEDLIASLGGSSACQPCHGADLRGTLLSRAQASRSLTVPLDQGNFTLNLYGGATIGCYNCHQGPNSSDLNPSAPPTVTGISTNTSNDKSLKVTLPVTGSAAVLRIVSQPAHGSVGLANNEATFFPEPGFVGTDVFTFAAYDGSKNSELATATINIEQGAFSIGATGRVPSSYPAMWSVPFAVLPAVTNCAAPVSYTWDFGDQSPLVSGQYPTHVYSLPGVYTWSVVAAVSSSGQSRSVTNSGTIQITAPIDLTAVDGPGGVTISWPTSLADTFLESSPSLAPSAVWTWVTNAPLSTPEFQSVTLPHDGARFFRVRRPW